MFSLVKSVISNYNQAKTKSDLKSDLKSDNLDSTKSTLELSKSTLELPKETLELPKETIENPLWSTFCPLPKSLFYYCNRTHFIKKPESKIVSEIVSESEFVSSSSDSN